MLDATYIRWKEETEIVSCLNKQKIFLRISNSMLCFEKKNYPGPKYDFNTTVH